MYNRTYKPGTSSRLDLPRQSEEEWRGGGGGERQMDMGEGGKPSHLRLSSSVSPRGGGMLVKEKVGT